MLTYLHSKMLWVFINVLFLVSTVTSNASDALRCNKLYTKNYFFGETCEIVGKTITYDTNLDNASPVPERVKTVKFRDSQVLYIPSQLFIIYGNLQYLFVNGTGLETISKDTFNRASQLTAIYLDQNNVKTIEAYAFNGAKELNIIDLSDNEIETLDENAFSGLSKLRQLYLGFNQLTSLPDTVFMPLNGLNILDLSNNNIDKISANTFSTNRVLQNVSLAANSLKELELNFTGNNVLLTIDASSNLIDRFNITWQRRWTREVNVFMSHNQWKCDELNATITRLLPHNVMLKPKQNAHVSEDADHVDGIECVDTTRHTLFGIDTSNFNWPIIGFVIGCSVVFIVGALVFLLCRRRRQGYWSTPV